MLTPLHLTPVQVDRTRYLPPLLLELVEAAEAGGDLVPAVLTIVRKLGVLNRQEAIAKGIAQGIIRMHV